MFRLLLQLLAPVLLSPSYAYFLEVWKTTCGIKCGETLRSAGIDVTQREYKARRATNRKERRRKRGKRQTQKGQRNRDTERQTKTETKKKDRQRETETKPDTGPEPNPETVLETDKRRADERQGPYVQSRERP